jgi:riboflavin transporter FmnP
MRRIWSTVVGLFANLFAGLRLALPLPVSRRAFQVSGDQAVLLLLAAAGATLLMSYPFGDGPATFDSGTWPVMGSRCLLVMLLYYIVARLQGGSRHFLVLAVVVLSAGISLEVFQALISWLGRSYRTSWVWFGYAVDSLMIPFVIAVCWSIAVVARSIRIACAARWLRTGVLTIVVTLGSLAINWALPPYFWYPASAAESSRAHRPWIDTEQTYYAQPRLLGQALAALKPERRGVTDLYFLGFAGTATQDVFLKEARAARQLFDKRFDTQGRSLLLVNNPATVARMPVASVTNLRRALAGIARKMNVDEDVLFLFLTSHGSPHRFSVHFPALALDDLSDTELKDMLDRSGIKWRVLVISACYSGSFIDRLKDERTLILTAARADRTSFGCSSENDFTYFGDAFINTALRRQRSFVAAFEEAKAIIARREADEKLTPSEPQIYLGAAMKGKLHELEHPAKRPLAAAAR